MNFASLLKLMRLKQWIKNVFVFAPLFFSPSLSSNTALQSVLCIFVAFCLTTSGVYCFNDFWDREADKHHPKKKTRPIPAGKISPATAVTIFVFLSSAGLVFGFATTNSGWTLLSYFVLTSLYTLILKRIAILDVLTIAFGFVLRIHAGAEAIEVQPTVWILVCTGMLALFIALTKRRDDLTQELDTSHRESLEGYSIAFLDAAFIMISTALVVSYVVFTTDDEAMVRLGSEKLYYTIPFVIAGTLRHLQLTMVFKKSGAPTELATSDPFLLICMAGWIATFTHLMY